MAALFALLAINLMTNQFATGWHWLCLGGLHHYRSATAGPTLCSARPDGVPLLRDLPFIGPAFFAHHWVVYASIALTATVAWFLFRTRAGLVLRAVGESPASAHALGHPVQRIRWAAVAFGGACAGLAGAYLATIYTPLWSEGVVAGRGWIALALVTFATWQPARVLLGAYLLAA